MSFSNRKPNGTVDEREIIDNLTLLLTIGIIQLLHVRRHRLVIT